MKTNRFFPARLVLAAAALLPIMVATPPILGQANAGKLLIYTIDVEGGQATLFVTPEKGSMLVDTGWPGFNGRDAGRIEAAMKDAGIQQIDRVLITHYHMDHVGGVPNLLQKVKVGQFVDHGDNREPGDETTPFYDAYRKASEGKRRTVKPGDSIDVPGLNVLVLTADGEHIATVPGVTPKPNASCASEPKHEADQTENARSAGVLITYGKFRLLDLGDLTKDKEVALVCPNNPLPRIDLYLATHHGFNLSNSKAVVDELGARVTIMDNGAHKAGSPEAWQTIHDASATKDIYMLHTAEGSDAAHNSAAPLVANPRGAAQDGAYFKVEANRDGSFSVMNSRTGEKNEYRP